jgi:asparagine synthase (glutamine-hydrolysing)
MCGLAGRFSPSALPPAPGWHRVADRLLAHRGPDGSGHFVDQRCELVHRRLALIDLSRTGAQPMPNEDGSVLAVFNGEIYNHRELRRELMRAGHAFRGGSDTEVLVHLYEHAGERFVERLRGIFALALYDRRAARLVLARDRYGVKPLFYFRTDGEWAFASEIKALAALPGFEPRLDRQACYDFLGLGYVPEPATGFLGVFALPPGTRLVVEPGRHDLVAYDRARATVDARHTLPTASGQLEAALLRAVERQSVADVPVAALLSGGIDSSLVVAARQRTDADPTRTFNVRFPDPDHDETPWAHAVARHCGTLHHTIDSSVAISEPDAVLDLLRHFDQPFADTSCFPMYAVARAVRDHGIICALSGDGGDEVFGGYARFWRANRIARLLRAPRWVRRSVMEAGRALAPWTRDLGRQVAKAASFTLDDHDAVPAILAGFASYLSESQKESLVRPDAREGLLPAVRLFDAGDAGGADLEQLSARMTDAVFALSLPSDMLRKVDMMSMRASIEVRVPLLDEDVVALGLTLPHRLKTDGRSGKLVPRELARRWLPPAVATHRKQGFTIPLDRTLPGSFYPVVHDYLAGPAARTPPLFADGAVAGWLARLREGAQRPSGGAVSRGGLAHRVFTVLALELWLREHALSW